MLDVETAADDFHARYSALEKTYIYRIVNGPVISPFWVRYAHHDARKLDLDRMQTAAQLFLGRHDWTAFSAAQSDVEDRVRNVTRVEITERADERARGSLIEIRVSAEGFLRYMVRAIAGTLMAIGRGELNQDAVSEALETRNRPISCGDGSRLRADVAFRALRIVSRKDAKRSKAARKRYVKNLFLN